MKSLFKRSTKSGQLRDDTSDDGAQDEYGDMATGNGLIAGHSDGSVPPYCTWENVMVRGDEPPGRRGATLDYDQSTNTFLMFGGEGDDPFGDLWRFDVEQRAWKMCDAIGVPPGARCDHISVIYKRRLYVVGGRRDREALCSMYSYDIEAGQWTKLPDAPAKVCSAAGVVVGSFWVILGGSNGKRAGSEALVYDFAREEWGGKFPKSLHLPAKVKGHSVVLTPTGLVAAMGSEEAKKMSQQVFQFVPEGDHKWKWTAVKIPREHPSLPRESAIVTALSQGVFVAGGSRGDEPLCDAFLYSNSKWTKVSLPDDTPPRVCPSIAKMHEKMVMFGGQSAEGFTSDLSYLTLNNLGGEFDDTAVLFPQGLEMMERRLTDWLTQVSQQIDRKNSSRGSNRIPEPSSATTYDSPRLGDSFDASSSQKSGWRMNPFSRKDKKKQDAEEGSPRRTSQGEVQSNPGSDHGDESVKTEDLFASRNSKSRTLLDREGEDEEEQHRGGYRPPVNPMMAQEPGSSWNRAPEKEDEEEATRKTGSFNLFKRRDKAEKKEKVWEGGDDDNSNDSGEGGVLSPQSKKTSMGLLAKASKILPIRKGTELINEDVPGDSSDEGVVYSPTRQQAESYTAPTRRPPPPPPVAKDESRPSTSLSPTSSTSASGPSQHRDPMSVVPPTTQPSFSAPPTSSSQPPAADDPFAALFAFPTRSPNPRPPGVAPLKPAPTFLPSTPANTPVTFSPQPQPQGQAAPSLFSNMVTPASPVKATATPTTTPCTATPNSSFAYPGFDAGSFNFLSGPVSPPQPAVQPQQSQAPPKGWTTF